MDMTSVIAKLDERWANRIDAAHSEATILIRNLATASDDVDVRAMLETHAQILIYLTDALETAVSRELVEAMNTPKE